MKFFYQSSIIVCCFFLVTLLYAGPIAVTGKIKEIRVNGVNDQAYVLIEGAPTIGSCGSQTIRAGLVHAAIYIQNTNPGQHQQMLTLLFAAKLNGSTVEVFIADDALLKCELVQFSIF